MAEESLITPELKELLGKELPPERFEVEKGHIRRFAQAVGDPNPLFRDADYARKTRYGGIIASPTFLLDISINTLAYQLMDKKPASTGFLPNGGIEVEYYQPMKVGISLPRSPGWRTCRRKSSRRGRLLFMTIAYFMTGIRGTRR